MGEFDDFDYPSEILSIKARTSRIVPLHLRKGDKKQDDDDDDNSWND